MKNIILDIRPWNKEYVVSALEAGIDEIIVPKNCANEVKKYGLFKVIPEDKLDKRFLVERITPKNQEKLLKLINEREVLIRSNRLDAVSLENLVAQNNQFYVQVRTPEEAETAVNVLEKGVYGIVLKPKNSEDIRETVRKVRSKSEKIKLVEAPIKKISPVGVGHRVFVDTLCYMGTGEGMLIGNTTDGYFLVHSESIENPYTGKRPFRVNAGGLHAYVLQPEDKTEYLSELKIGDPILIVDSRGKTQQSRIGRIKIEKRPLVLVEAEYKNKTISHYLQNASTVNLVVDSKPKPLTELSIGDNVLTHVRELEGRHYGMKIQEEVIEK